MPIRRFYCIQGDLERDVDSEKELTEELFRLSKEEYKRGRRFLNSILRRVTYNGVVGEMQLGAMFDQSQLNQLGFHARIPDQEWGCKEGFDYLFPTGVCYKVFKQESDFTDADQTCADLNATLIGFRGMAPDVEINPPKVYLSRC